METVFISYSHKDEKWKDRVMIHLGVLEKEGILKLWNDRDIETGADWFREIETELSHAKVVVMLITANFLTSGFILGEEVPRILQRRRSEGILVAPVVVEPCAWQPVKWLSSMQLFPKDGIPLSTLTKPKADTESANLAKMIHRHLAEGSKTGTTHRGKDTISIYKLPVTGGRLFGREKELAFLHAAWTDVDTHIVTLVAWGGVGKTALVNGWLNEMQTQDYGGARRVYGWSFYSQGAEEGKQASADEFFQETLAWFGDPHPEAGSNVEKGRRLARLARKQKNLLILDGMEPLQYPPGEVQGLDGKLKDAGMAAFLKELAAGCPGTDAGCGLCVITTREAVTDLEHRVGFGEKEAKLEHLHEEAGVALLKSLGVATGSDEDFKAAVKEYEGHALALTLLGHYIKGVHKGDIRRRDKIQQLTKERRRGRHARRVMQAYERWLGDSPELNILYIMGLFDRPAQAGALAALKEEPSIPGVTDQLGALSKEDWQWALSNLRAVRLLREEAPRKNGVGGMEGTLDCHPLVREHFGERLRDRNPGGWKATHQRLYHYFKNLPEKKYKKKYPDTLAEMEPLFAAVAHGCKAGLHLEALVEVYWKRIVRGKEAYTVHKLGAFGADLAALSHFFDVPWRQPAAGLTEADKAVVLSWAAFRLRAVGRLREAIQPMNTGLEISIQQDDWKGATQDASNLSELMLTLGEVTAAVDYARRSVTYADCSGDEFTQEYSLTTLADALHQSGQLAEAEKWFREAEAMQKKRQPQYPFLYSLPGFRFCDLLLEKRTQGTVKEVMERAEKFFEWRLPSDSLLTISLDNLTAGRAWMMQAKTGTSGDFSRAAAFLEQAVTGLREAGVQEYLVRGLFARSECYRRMKDFSKARDDLDEAEEIAELGSMKLFLCDYYLEAAKLCRAEGKEAEAKEHLQTAEWLIEETKYYRRKI
jgi:tetratricopeptide (TPR) repeat protein